MHDSTTRHPIDLGVTASNSLPQVLDPRVGLRSSLVAGVVGGTLALGYRITGWGLPCPFLALTGWWCPLCGSTRMGARIMAGDLSGAVHANPVVFGLLGLWAIAVALWTVEVVRGRLMQGPHRRWTQSQIYLVLGITFAVFTLVRNLA